MPTFYRPANRRHELAAVVWNPRANAQLADFITGNLFTTEDPYVIQELRKLGYPTVEDYEAQQAAPQIPPPPHVLQATPVVQKPVVQKTVPPKAPAKKAGVKPTLKKRASPQPPESMDTDVSPSDP